ncbi:MAG: TetR/AcrR family transcriptional regulator [Pseudomonadota bacterium]
MPRQAAASSQLAGRILDQALALAEAQDSWEALRLHQVADAMGIPLADVLACYAQKDDLAEAWFDCADRAALLERDTPGFAALPATGRLERVMMAWLDALAPHRRLTRGMLAYKLEPGHLHLQLPGLARISRTVQWFREVAGLDGRGLRRIAGESGLTLLYLSAFARWLYDETPGGRATRGWLAQSLQRHAGCLCVGAGRMDAGRQQAPVAEAAAEDGG